MTRASRSKSPINELSDVSSELDSDSEIPSLKSKADQLARTVKKLKNYKPEVRKRGRPKNVESEEIKENCPELIPLLESLLAFSSQILKKVEQVEKKNSDLEVKLDKFLPNGISALTESSSSFPTNKLYSQAVTGHNAEAVKFPEIHDLSSRLDQIEQESLAHIIKLDGDCITNIIAKGHTEEETEQRKEPFDMKKETIDVIRTQITTFSE